MAKLSPLAGILGPILFAAALLVLSVLEYPFMRTLGWDPLSAPTLDWPSGLALGPYGAAMTAAFILGGALMALFALGLRRALRQNPAGRLASVLLLVAGAALCILSFPTDPTLSHPPPTLHGRLHDLAYVVLGLSLFTAMLAFGYAFRREPAWRNLSLYTWLTAALVLPAAALKGAAFYVFLGAVLLWSEVIAVRLCVGLSFSSSSR
jgi:hypothetical protein